MEINYEYLSFQFKPNTIVSEVMKIHHELTVISFKLIVEHTKMHFLCEKLISF